VIIIGIAGKTHSGKSSLAMKLNHSYGWPIASFAEGVRAELASAWFKGSGLTKRYTKWAELEVREGKGAVRNLLQAWGHGRRVLTNESHWVDMLFKTLEGVDDEVIVIDDVRYPNEIQAILDRGGFIVRLHADAETLFERGANPEALSHPSENAISRNQTLHEALATNRVFQIETGNRDLKGVFCVFLEKAMGSISREINSLTRMGVGD
jgi:hypothetical protein